MNDELVTNGWEMSYVSSSEKLVLMRLCFHADDKTSECYLSIKSIASDTCLDKKTVQSCLWSLEEKGLIVKTGRMEGSTKSIPVYRIVLCNTKRGYAI